MKPMNEIIQKLKESATQYRDYYKVLNLDKNNIDDEKVLKAYEEECKKIEAFFRGNITNELLEIKKLMLLSVNDAYTALKTEHSRKNYQQMLDTIKNKKRNIEPEGTDR